MGDELGNVEGPEGYFVETPGPTPRPEPGERRLRPFGRREHDAERSGEGRRLIWAYGVLGAVLTVAAGLFVGGRVMARSSMPQRSPR